MWEKIGILVSFLGLIIAFFQLDTAKDEIALLKKHLKEVKKIHSIQAAEGYLSKPQLIAAKKVINSKTSNGRDYSLINDDVELNNAVISILNYLETLATGVKASIYDDSVLCSHLKEVVNKQVEVHIKGQRPEGVEKTNPQPFSYSEFKQLSDMYNRWLQYNPCP